MCFSSGPNKPEPRTKHEPDLMRIFCAIRHANDPKQFYGGLWSANFYPALRELGHELIESQTDLLPTSRFMNVADGFTLQELEARARTTEQILAEVRAAHQQVPVGLFLSYFYNAHFDPSGYAELRRLGIPSVNFYCNSIHQFSHVAGIAAQADFAWHAEREARNSYLGAGAKPIWVQMGADPKVYFPVPGLARASKACFVGQRYADRDQWMAALIRAEVPVDIFGQGWGAEPGQPAPVAAAGSEEPSGYLGRMHPTPGSRASYVAALQQTLRRDGWWCGLRRVGRQWQQRRERRKLAPLFAPHAKGVAQSVANAFSSYELCLNFSNVWADGRPGSPLIPHVRLRDFEAPMCRTCYLTGHSDEITEFYEVGKEIETYSSPEEFVDKARFYLAHPDAALKLREAGYRRALSDHTWKRRFEALFTKLNLGNA